MTSTWAFNPFICTNPSFEKTQLLNPLQPKASLHGITKFNKMQDAIHPSSNQVVPYVGDNNGYGH
jgi:hypothetical protein